VLVWLSVLKPLTPCEARGYVAMTRCQQEDTVIPRSATGFSYGKRHRGGARDDSNLILDSVELTDLFIGRLDMVGR
jgi:hypothetical protein